MLVVMAGLLWISGAKKGASSTIAPESRSRGKAGYSELRKCDVCCRQKKKRQGKDEKSSWSPGCFL